MTGGAGTPLSVQCDWHAARNLYARGVAVSSNQTLTEDEQVLLKHNPQLSEDDLQRWRLARKQAAELLDAFGAESTSVSKTVVRTATS